VPDDWIDLGEFAAMAGIARLSLAERLRLGRKHIRDEGKARPGDPPQPEKRVSGGRVRQERGAPRRRGQARRLGDLPDPAPTGR
jgi:hypothetical protein